MKPYTACGEWVAMFGRVAIVNRGEAAMRFIHAVREWNAEGRPTLRTIALHSAADRRAMFVREADEAELIGPSDADAFGANPYLDYAELERALRATRAEAVWPGWGFVSEQAGFAELCGRLGVVFIGPPPEVMRRLGDKIAAKRLAERVGVPVAPWSGGPVETLGQARDHAPAIGYPLMVKSAAGGGGRGIRAVTGPEELADAFERARAEAARTSGDPTVFLEPAIRGGRHVEVQVVADGHGGVWTLGVRDCSVQRRNQKVIEESASTALDAEQETLLRTASADLVRAAGYVNAGTVEFLYEPDKRVLAFLEVNTRLQVEHPVTEATTGVDIVKLQLHVAAGGRLAGPPPGAVGHAIEARLTAEDPDRGFAPAPGVIEHLALPGGPGIRVDTGVAAGDVIPPQYDSMIAKIVAWGRDRDEARGRLARAVRQTSVVIDGGTTNKAFLLDLLTRPELVTGVVDTGWLDRLMAAGYAPPRRLDVALVAAAVEAYDLHSAAQQAGLYASAARGRPEVVHEMDGHRLDVTAAGAGYRLRVARTRRSRYRVELDGRAVEVDVDRQGRHARRLAVGGRNFPVLAVSQGADHLIEVDGVAHRISSGDAGLVRAPAPAVVVAIPAAAGAEVEEGAAVVVLESMKLETAVRAPFAGRVGEVLVAANTQVEAGAPLLRLEPRVDPADQAEEPAGGPRTDLAALAAGSERPPELAERAADTLTALRWLVLGFDGAERDVRGLLADLAAARADLPPDHPTVLAGETAILRIFADLCALSRNRRSTDEGEEDEQAHNPQEYLNAFLRSRDAQLEQLPATFRDKLRRALAHYDVPDLEPSTELDGALFWMLLAHQRAAAHVPVVLELLQWRLRHPTSLPAQARDDFRDTLDRLVTATQLRHPVVGDLARQVRYRCFDAPLIAAARASVHRQVRAELDQLADHPQAVDYAARIEALVASPEPVFGLLAERHSDALLEVMTRRHYKIRQLDRVESAVRDGRRVLSAGYRHDGERFTVLAAAAAEAELPAAAATLAGLASELPAGETALVDLYVTAAGPTADGDELAGRVRAALGRPRPPVARVAVALAHPGDEQIAEFTFRSDGERFTEDGTLRGLHPMVAQRLALWRLANFELTRLPAAAHVHLFHAVGREVRADERLIALAEVRGLTVRTEAAGAIRALPQLERVLDACLDSLRAARSASRAAAKLEWNRIFLYVWPAIDAPIDALDGVVRQLAPRAEGLGLEQVLVQFRLGPSTAVPEREFMVRLSRPPGAGLTVQVTDPPTTPLRPLDGYAQKVIQARRRGAVYPYELLPLLAGGGGFTEYDLDADGDPVPVDRPPGGNTANLVLGVVRTPTDRYPEGMTRVVLLGDPTRALGALAEPECRRVNAALDLAERLSVPVEWFAVSAGAKIAMNSGTENMDWISRTLRRIIEFTQCGGEINVVVTGINVGAQPYWNAEATMLMHTRGILVMTPDSAMVLTGKQSLDYSGGVSAEDNFGIGGYDRIMGPNGQAQYWAADLTAAVGVLLAHYEHTYRAPGERFPRPAASVDPLDRDVRTAPHSGPGTDFTTVGQVFSATDNPQRKKPFDIRSVLRAVIDADHPPLERWVDMQDAEGVVVFDAHLGGAPVCLIGVESRPLPRRGLPPVDGPGAWSAGTLFPRSSKKTARAINAASGNRPLVVLANLSGFDGSPESLRNLQLEYGAEIGRAIVNFAGPIVFCVISRYHGGAFVVFSGTLHDNMQVAAVEGSHASVIGGAPAAAVVFAGEVNRRTAADPRLIELQARIGAGGEAEAARLRAELVQLRAAVRAEKLGEVAEEFDAEHSVQRAHRVGSVHTIVPAAGLRAYLIEAVRRGMARSVAGGSPQP
jgi:acetyl/propionyl-CoA carboxylase alpha subunit/acetyl-CoA carboxylase carboxyltransferase component